VTAILGFNCTDGLLFLADTEETIGATKSECEKLQRLTLPCGVVVLGGAGDSDWIDYATFRAPQRLLQKPFSGWANIHEEVNEFAKRITKEMVGAYKGFDPLSVPTIEMLIGVQPFKNGVQMYRWRSNIATPITGPSVSVGCGITQMNPMLSDLQDAKYNPYSVSGSCEAMLFHGVRIMRQTKRTVQSCGKRTEALA